MDIRRTIRNTFLIIFFIMIALPNAVNAINFKDEGLDDGEIITPYSLFADTEVHGDVTLTNQWIIDQAGPNQRYRLLLDYRGEFHTPLYSAYSNKGFVVTRIEGWGFFAGNPEDNFFGNQTINLPELFYKNISRLPKNNSFTFVFGKFANRRFYDKDQISPDSFDMGERPFFGAIANTLNLLNSINEFRDSDEVISGSRMATGSYGITFGIKNHNANSLLFDGWGYYQAFAFADTDRFKRQFYGISEINKNWGIRYPGQFNLGFIYADHVVFRVVNGRGRANLLYTSVVQRIKFLTPYFRWATLFSEDNRGHYHTNELRLGVIAKVTRRDILTTHLVYIDHDDLRFEVDSTKTWISFWRHEFHKNLVGWFYVVPKFDVASPFAPQGDDSTTIGFELQGVL